MTNDNVTKFPGLPVPGYVEQSATAIDMVTNNKQAEEYILRILDALKADPAVDQRWLAIGRTHIEQGWMAINRSIFKPVRIRLPDEENP